MSELLTEAQRAVFDELRARIKLMGTDDTWMPTMTEERSGGSNLAVYRKLQSARVTLQATQMQKSGHNKFAGYQYFELGDFLPQINRIFEGLGLCSVVSFDRDMATLTIIDTESGGQIVFTSPMEKAELKGCHPIQNLGAVETYSRRYLYVTALEIVEHDALDSAPPVDKPKAKIGDGLTVTPTAGVSASLTAAQREKVDRIASTIVDMVNAEDYDAAYAEIEICEFEPEEKVYLSEFMTAAQRRKVKEAGQKFRAQEAAKNSNPLNA